MPDKTSERAEQSAMDRLTRLGLMTEASRHLVTAMMESRDEEMAQIQAQRDAALHSSTELGKANVEWQKAQANALKRAFAAEAERDALKAELADVEGVVTDLGVVRLELQSELAEARAAIRRERAQHFQYRFAGDDTTDYCGHCNKTTGGWVAWSPVIPRGCPTVIALDAILAALDAPQRPEDTREETGSGPLSQ